MNAESLSMVALLIGGYGAVLSTLNYLRDRVDVRVTFSTDMQSSKPEHLGKTFTDVHVVNHGKRPTSIMSVGYRSRTLGLVMLDTEPSLPCTLGDGEHVCALIDQRNLDFNDVAYFFAWDARRHTFKSIPLWLYRLARRVRRPDCIRSTKI